MRRLSCVIVIASLVASAARAGDWPAFRGPSGNGISQETDVPIEWSKDKNIKWRVPLPPDLTRGAAADLLTAVMGDWD